MDTFELFEHYCSITIEIEKEKRERKEISQDDFKRGNAYDAYKALKTIEKFKIWKSKLNTEG